MGHPAQTWGKDSRATAKECKGQCGQVLPIDAFAIKNGKTGLRRSFCRDCHNVATREAKHANREKTRAANAAYRAAHREELAERQRRWRLDNPEAYQAIHSKWKSGNTESVNASTHKRRAAIKGNGGAWTATEWKDLKARYDHRCLMCQRQEPEISLTVDHVVPIDKGGPNVIENIQPLCKSCNSKKHRGIIDLRPLTQSTLL